MVSKLSWHIQSISRCGWVVPYVHAARPRYVKQLFYGGDEIDFFPDQRTIARLWIGGDAAEQWYIQRGAQGAREYFGLLLPRYQALRGKVWGIEGPNEPPVGSQHERRCLAEFTAEWAYLVYRLWLRPLVGCFSNGNPDVTNDAAMRELAPVWAQPFTYLALHQYGCPSLQNEAPWFSLRHRMFLQACQRLGLRRPPIFITEAGWDGTGTTWGKKGWRSLCGSWAVAASQLEWYEREVGHDPHVISVHLFNTGNNGGWEDYEHGPDESRWLCQHIQAGGR